MLCRATSCATSSHVPPPTTPRRDTRHEPAPCNVLTPHRHRGRRVPRAFVGDRGVDGKGVGEVTERRVLARMRTVQPLGDARALRSFAWLVTGMRIEQDARLPRIALAMVGPQTMDARVRRCGDVSTVG